MRAMPIRDSRTVVVGTDGSSLAEPLHDVVIVEIIAARQGPTHPSACDK
jgi:hypothetical protein